MRRLAINLLAGSVLATSWIAGASAQTSGATPSAAGIATAPDAGTPSTVAAAPADATALGDIVVTARKRAETLLDVPIAVTAVSGDTLVKNDINSVREAAVLTPGLNISSDGAGRAFVSIRGIGVTLVGTVQPGVGLFIDGIYRPNTAYLNNPLLDVDRIEVLEGPQGTLYGKNTLGGAINVITRQPGNNFEARGQASYAGPDDSWLVSGSVSGPIVEDKLQVRVAASHRQQDGFIRNTTIGGDANKYNTDSVNTTIRAEPTENLTITINGYYDWIKGTNVPYARVTGPTDYSRDNQFNTLGTTNYHYKGINAKIENPIDAIDTKVTLLAAYDANTANAPDTDGDFGPTDTVRQSAIQHQSTKTLELRFDTQETDTISTLFGLFYSHEYFAANSVTNISVPAFGINLHNTEFDKRVGNTYAAFGTAFWKPSTAWEVALGLRYDHEARTATGAINTVDITPAHIKSNEVEPRLTVTRHWNPQLMTYASASRGYRGGGFNPPSSPLGRTYRGDYAWTYELGTKYANSRFSLSGDVFYNNYYHYIGLNSIAPASTGGLVTVDLNAGHVHGYGAELEAKLRVTNAWTLSGSATYQHSRLINDSEYVEVTGRQLSSDRLTFQPDWLYNLSSDYVVKMHGDDTLTFSGGVNGKGSRLAATLNQTTPTVLKAYALVNGSITWQHGPFEFAVFANNLLNKHYFESYIEKTTVELANIPLLTGLPARDLGIIGDLRRYGVRAGFKF